MLHKNPPKMKPEMVFVKGGSFFMGDVFDSSNSDALPAHQVTVEDFYIGKFEVTFKQYDDFALSTDRSLPNDRGFGRGERAVVYINWEEANAFCNYWGWRLPTETEWEYAARSGGKSYRFAGTNDQDSLDRFAITVNSNIEFSYLIGSKEPNGIGLFDMSGNVLEMVSSFYQDYSKPDQLHDLDESSLRIIRGGSFDEEIETNQTFWRVGTYDLMIHNDVGFRCAISRDEVENKGLFNGFFNIGKKKP
jgi:formylglycine-generating enzyme required for sulfatase activity